jgi:hypothetical protein
MDDACLGDLQLEFFVLFFVLFVVNDRDKPQETRSILGRLGSRRCSEVTTRSFRAPPIGVPAP